MTKNSVSTIAVADLIATRMATLSKTAFDLANDIGTVSSSLVSMIATGRMKLPTSSVVAFANALGIDATHLLRLTLREYHSDLLELVENLLERPLLSANEAALIDRYREATAERDPAAVIIAPDNVIAVIVA